MTFFDHVAQKAPFTRALIGLSLLRSVAPNGKRVPVQRRTFCASQRVARVLVVVTFVCRSRAHMRDLAVWAAVSQLSPSLHVQQSFPHYPHVSKFTNPTMATPRPAPLCL